MECFHIKRTLLLQIWVVAAHRERVNVSLIYIDGIQVNCTCQDSRFLYNGSLCYGLTRQVMSVPSATLDLIHQCCMLKQFKDYRTVLDLENEKMFPLKKMLKDGSFFIFIVRVVLKLSVKALPEFPKREMFVLLSNVY